jgi:glycosyltransferase involved in cell wall biosynthesis
MPTPVRALFVNSGILGQRTFAAFVENVVLPETGRVTGEQVIVADDLTVGERLRRRALCAQFWPDGLGGLRNLDLRRYRAELNAGLVAAGKIARLERRRGRFDVLHFHRQATAYASLARMKATPSIVSIDCTQGTVVGAAQTGVERRTYGPNIRRDGDIFRAARLVIATSKWAADSVRREYPDCETEIAVMHSPVELQHFDPSWAAERSAQVGLTARPRVLFVGGDFPRKGGYDLLEAWRSGRFGERASLDIVTNWPIDRRRLSEGVAIHRNIASHSAAWRRVWREADIFVLPTRDEAFGAVFQEAAGAGLPSIGTSINAVPELIEDGITGLLVPPRDQPALARALDALVRSADTRQAMGSEARSRIERTADPLAYRDALIAALHSVAGIHTCAA